MRFYIAVPVLVVVAGGLVLSSCSSGVRYKKTSHPTKSTEKVVTKKGPPPHAPAHGYRHKHGSVVLVYKSELGIYTVDGHEGYYFHESAYYRSHKGKWQKSKDMKGPWKKVSDSNLPASLQSNQHAKAKKGKK